MPNARTALVDALRAPMTTAGWRPRAGGWFTSDVAPGVLGVVSVGAATKRAASGAAQASAHVGLRFEAVETTVARVCGVKDEGYKARTLVTGLGYLSPAKAWQEWGVSDANAAQVATDMADAVSAYTPHYFDACLNDTTHLLHEVRRSPAWEQSVGLVRYAVLAAQRGRTDEARQMLAERLAAASGRADVAAEDLRRVATPLRAWLDQHGE